MQSTLNEKNLLLKEQILPLRVDSAGKGEKKVVKLIPMWVYYHLN